MTETHPGPFGILSDAHGNPYGLRAALEMLRTRGAKTVFFLGDAVGYLPLEGEVIELLRKTASVCVSGNHEAMLLDRMPRRADDICRLAAARARMSSADLDELRSWPDRRLVADSRAPSRRLSLAHGAPNDPLRTYVYPNSDVAFIDDLDCAAFACGHTHHAFVRRRGEKLVVNCGSVGLPRDVSGMASCVFLDLVTLEYEILRRHFDVDRLLEESSRVAPPHADVVAILRRHLVADVAGRIG
jgi:predicted phosphodiesterase